MVSWHRGPIGKGAEDETGGGGPWFYLAMSQNECEMRPRKDSICHAHGIQAAVYAGVTLVEVVVRERGRLNLGADGLQVTEHSAHGMAQIKMWSQLNECGGDDDIPSQSMKSIVWRK